MGSSDPPTTRSETSARPRQLMSQSMLSIHPAMLAPNPAIEPTAASVPLAVPSSLCSSAAAHRERSAALWQSELLRNATPSGIPSTSQWTGAVIIVQYPRTKTCIVTRPRTSPGPMPSSLAG